MWILLTLKSVEIIFIYIIRPPLLCSGRILQSAAFYHKGTSLSPPRLPRCATDGCELSVLCLRFRSFFISMNWLCLRHKPTFQSLRRNSERNTLRSHLFLGNGRGGNRDGTATSLGTNSLTDYPAASSRMPGPIWLSSFRSSLFMPLVPCLHKFARLFPVPQAIDGQPCTSPYAVPIPFQPPYISCTCASAGRPAQNSHQDRVR